MKIRFEVRIQKKEQRRNAMRKIQIDAIGVDYATNEECYRVEVGCKAFIFINKKTLSLFMAEYLSDPEKTEKNWYAKHEEKREEGLARTVEPVPQPEQPEVNERLSGRGTDYGVVPSRYVGR